MPVTSDSFVPDDQDIADFGGSGGEELEDTKGTYVKETYIGEEKIPISDHVCHALDG